MNRHIDILAQQDSLRSPFLQSLAFHAVMGLSLAGAALWQGTRGETFGDPNAIPGGTPITPVASIPMINRTSQVNPVANDTESLVPKAQEQKKAREQPDPDAVGLGKKDQKKKKQSKLDLEKYIEQRRKAFDEAKPNQLSSSTGAAASSPLFGKPGSGGIGLGDGNPFGNRFGGYASVLRECVARNWNTSDVDPNLRTAPMVIVAFEILRNGATRNVRIVQQSNNVNLNYSCQRAVESCSPFPALPNEYERNSATVEFRFQLKR